MKIKGGAAQTLGLLKAEAIKHILLLWRFIVAGVDECPR